MDIKFVTLNTITEDLLNTIRGAEIAVTEPISKRQLEDWVHRYRALLIKRDLDKDRLISPDYVQELVDLPVSLVSAGIYETDDEIPNTVFRSQEDGFTWIGNGDTEYQYMSGVRALWQQYRKWVADTPYAVLRNHKIRTNVDGPITIRGIFENPMEAARFYGPHANVDSYYPMPIALVPALKEMILKNELGIIIKAEADDTNDSKHDLN